MAIAFTYTKSTNRAVVTGGTSGTPATFADFVTADRAGSVTLLAAWTPNSNTKALTYQITPVEKLALLISFVVASKTAEADYIFITGTDAWDAAQTEAIDVTAGNGTYVSTKRFRTITNIDCSDNATGGGTVWADGTVAVTQPQWGVIWSFGNRNYNVDSYVDFGDGTTATFFRSYYLDCVVWATGVTFSIKANATLELGILSGSWGVTGAVWSINFNKESTASYIIATGVSAIFNMYSSVIFDRSTVDDYHYLAGGTIDIRESMIQGISPSTGRWYLTANISSLSIDGLIMSGNRHFYSYTTPTSFKSFHGNGMYICFLFGASITLKFALLTSNTYDIQIVGAYTGSLLDPKQTVNAAKIFLGASSVFREQYTCNINVCDKNGVAISGAIVDCIDQTSTAVWAAGTVTTDVNGNITEQIINYKSWATASKTLTTYSPHKFTISKAGYQTLVLENITVDHPIVWHLELLPDPILLSSGKLAKKISDNFYLQL